MGLLPCSEVISKYFTDGQAERIAVEVKAAMDSPEDMEVYTCFDLESSKINFKDGAHIEIKLKNDLTDEEKINARESTLHVSYIARQFDPKTYTDDDSMEFAVFPDNILDFDLNKIKAYRIEIE